MDDEQPASVTPTPPDRSPETPGETRPAPREVGGPTGPEPTRYGDWERKGRCYDF